MEDYIASSSWERVNQLWATYDSSIQSGEYLPFGYPWGLLSAVVTVVYLILPIRSSRFPTGRFATWLTTVSISWYAIRFSRARNASTSYSLGLAHAWIILWATAPVSLQ